MDIKPQIIYRKLEQNFEKRGFINLEQKEVNSIQDLVEISNIFNSQRYESFRIVYLKDNKIKGYETITSHIPDRVYMNDCFKTHEINSKRFYYKVQNRMDRLKANNYYLVHNHPSGISNISREDIKLTKDFINHIKGFKGHLVLGEDNYSWILEDKKGLLQIEDSKNIDFKKIQKVSEKINTFYDIQTSKTLNSNLTDDEINVIENYSVNSRNDLVNLMKYLTTLEDFSPVILTDAHNKIRLILDIPNKMLNMSEKQIKGYFKNLAILNGASRIFLATKEKEVFRTCLKHFRNGTFEDLIYYRDIDKNHTQIVEAPKEVNQNKLFSPPRPKINFGTIKIENNKIQIEDSKSLYFDNSKDDESQEDYITIPAFDIDNNNIIIEEIKNMKENIQEEQNKLTLEKAKLEKEKERQQYEERLNNDEDDLTKPKRGQVRIILKRVGKKPLIKVINNNLKEKQKLVGGFIEVVDYDDKNLLICNEEGKILGLKPNIGFTFDYIAGDCFVIGDDYKNAGFKSVNLKDCEQIKKNIKNKSYTYEDKSPSNDKQDDEREL